MKATSLARVLVCAAIPALASCSTPSAIEPVGRFSFQVGGRLSGSYYAQLPDGEIAKIAEIVQPTLPPRHRILYVSVFSPTQVHVDTGRAKSLGDAKRGYTTTLRKRHGTWVITQTEEWRVVVSSH